MLLLLSLLGAAAANENGLARTPPMGWRSWNLFGPNVNQALMERIMEGMVSKKRRVDGVPTSLCDLGYCDVGLDDNWQLCGQYPTAVKGVNYTYHDPATGRPVVNESRFPSFARMTAKAHALGLTAGWYGNNCLCADGHSDVPALYEGDVLALLDYGFDSWKLDGCGKQRNLSRYDELIRKHSPDKAILVENCHWGVVPPFAPDPGEDFCPWNFYRTSQDVFANYASVMSNLNSTFQFADTNRSYPGCWAYPDMLEVGTAGGVHGSATDPGLDDAETRTHFAAWAIVSSPLTLSHDVWNDTIVDRIWPVIANRDAIRVNQAYVGHSGSRFFASAATVALPNPRRDYPRQPAFVVVPEAQYLYKRVSDTETAVLLVNSKDEAATLVLAFADVPDLPCAEHCYVRQIFAKTDAGLRAASYTTTLRPHDVAFLLLSLDPPTRAS